MPIPGARSPAHTPTQDPGDSAAPAALRWIALAGVVVLTLLAFAPALRAGFVDFDDDQIIVENLNFRGLGAAHVAWMFTTTHMGHYQPLTWITFAIDHAIAGMNPWQYHLTNNLLHAASAAMVLVLTLRLGWGEHGWRRATKPALLAGALAAAFWACHPLRVESVAWVTERRDVLSIALLLGAMLAYLNAFQRDAAPLIALRDEADPAARTRRKRWYAVCLALLACSLLAKAWGMSFFVLALIVDWYPLRRLPVLPWRWLAREARPVLLQKVPMVVLGVAAAVMAGAAQSSVAAAQTLADWPVTSRVAQAAYGLVWYLQKTVWPGTLVPLIELPTSLDWTEPRWLARYAIVLATMVAALAAYRRAPWLTAVCAAYTVLLLPILGTFQSGYQFVADRYSYVALIGWSVVLGAGLGIVLTRARPRLAALVAIASAVVVAALVPLTRAQTRIWHDAPTLWRHTYESGLAGPVGIANHGSWTERLGDPERAIELYREALALDPNSGRAWQLLATTLRSQRRFNEAEAAYRQASRTMVQAFEAHTNLGSMLFHQLGRREEGLAELRAAVEDLRTPRQGIEARRPLSIIPFLALANALRVSGDLAGARAALNDALGFTQATDYIDRAPDAMNLLRLIDQASSSSGGGTGDGSPLPGGGPEGASGGR